jgi:hypothetical protein
MLTPPESFGCVEDGVYRCCSINPVNLQFVLTLGVGVIISLNPEKPSKALRNFAHENNMEFVHLGIQPWRPRSDWVLMGKEILQDVLTYVLDKRNHPILIMDGTYAFVGTLRRVQHWTYSSIVGEYRAFAGSKVHYMTEIFLEMLDINCITHQEALERRKSLDQEKVRQMSRRGRSRTIVVHTPQEDVLPDWFRRQRALWAEESRASSNDNSII